MDSSFWWRPSHFTELACPATGNTVTSRLGEQPGWIKIKSHEVQGQGQGPGATLANLTRISRQLLHKTGMHWTERLTHAGPEPLASVHASRSVWPLAGRGRVQVGRCHRRRRRGRTRPQRKAPLPRHPGTAVPVACVPPPGRRARASHTYKEQEEYIAPLGTVSQITAHTATDRRPAPALVRTHARTAGSDVWPAVSVGRTRHRIRWMGSEVTGRGRNGRRRSTNATVLPVLTLLRDDALASWAWMEAPSDRVATAASSASTPPVLVARAWVWLPVPLPDVRDCSWA